MKKILLIISVFLVFINVSAKEVNTYYSDYGNWSCYSTDIISKTDLVDIEIERRYKWYKNVKKGEYMLYFDGINKYDNVDLDDFKETDYSTWSESEVEKISGRVVESEVRYSVERIKPIKKIYIMGGDFKTEEVDLNKIEIYNKEQKVNFDTTCSSCSSSYSIMESGFIEIQLDDDYYFDDLKIVISPSDISNINSLNFVVTAKKDGTRGEPIFYTLLYKNSNNKNPIVLGVKDFTKLQPQYEDKIIYKELPSVSYSDIVKEIVYYRYKDKLYYFYDIDNEYLDDYFKEKKDYIKDENNYLDYYRYRSRDKIELSDYIEITDKNDKIENYIKSTTDYQIDGKIDYKQNGIYHIKVKTYFTLKEIPVFVNVKENEKEKIVEKENTDLLDKYNKLQDQNNNLFNNYETLKKKNEDLRSKYENLDKKYNSLLLEKNNVLKETYVIEDNKCEEELEKVILKNDDTEKKLKLSNQAYEYLSSSLLKINNDNFNLGLSWYFWLFLLIILLLLIIIILKIKKNKNKF